MNIVENNHQEKNSHWITIINIGINTIMQFKDTLNKQDKYRWYLNAAIQTLKGEQSKTRKTDHISEIHNITDTIIQIFLTWNNNIESPEEIQKNISKSLKELHINYRKTHTKYAADQVLWKQKVLAVS